MKSESVKMTTAEFAKLHGVNKRTLHYYDNIGLFSPCFKGENNYRYYDYLQSMEFEYIRMLKELNLSIEEIKNFLHNPDMDDFLYLADIKISELNREIQKLKKTRDILQHKKQMLELCKTIQNHEIKIVQCEEEHYLISPFHLEEDDLQKLFIHVKDTWTPEQYRQGVGSYISMEKIKNRNFDSYDGLFTPVNKKCEGNDFFTMPKGTYLRAYHKGSWDMLPKFYEDIMEFAEKQNISLTGYAYEIGMNDFSISGFDDYVTLITIKADM